MVKEHFQTFNQLKKIKVCKRTNSELREKNFIKIGTQCLASYFQPLTFHIMNNLICDNFCSLVQNLLCIQHRLASILFFEPALRIFDEYIIRWLHTHDPPDHLFLLFLLLLLWRRKWRVLLLFHVIVQQMTVHLRVCHENHTVAIGTAFLQALTT